MTTESINTAPQLLDADGYPLATTLFALQAWTLEDTINSCLNYLEIAWSQSAYGTVSRPTAEELIVLRAKSDALYLHLATGGWSGNEALLDAFRNNENYLWTATWRLSTHGGVHIFQYVNYE